MKDVFVASAMFIADGIIHVNADNSKSSYTLKNFVWQGAWKQRHDCGGDHSVGEPGSCTVCRKENAKLANYPLQPIERCSHNCVATFRILDRGDDHRPSQVCAEQWLTVFTVSCNTAVHTGITMRLKCGFDWLCLCVVHTELNDTQHAMLHKT